MLKKRLLILFCLAAGLTICATAASALQIDGVVISKNGPVADGRVIAYPDYASLRHKQNAILSTPGEKPGEYRLTVPPGKYYLVAEGSDNTVLLYGYHGLNPIHVEEEYRWIPMLVLPEHEAACRAGRPGIGGTVLYRGLPAAGSSISVYAMEEEPFRGMGLLTNTVPEDGTFNFDLEPGTYVVIARKRHAGGAIGPIRKGDLVCYFSANPIRVEADQSCRIEISCYPRDDLNAFLADGATDPRGQKEEGRRAASLQETDETGSTRLLAAQSRKPAFISGRVTDLNGIPLDDLYISAYPAEEVPLFQMYVLRLKAEHMTRTDNQGFFRLELKSGSYYLVAREKTGDAPLAGEYYGIYEGSPNHSISLKADEIRTGVHITAESIIP